ncbi:MAG: class I SAM-dependent methyltransferase [Scytolyngbya sp. HA4215-MV1]|jgi:SAM-dependent MidA family methyltransferase|nr:class I SAM-dependent methyltransferase [Scytolyngbya sp. HA4215-MV1]
MTNHLAQNGNRTLREFIAHQITKSLDQRITFADYMNLALYQAQHGYYAMNGRTIGSQGDFFTAPHLGADFGELLAEQFVEMWQVLGHPVPFTLVEMGAGQGLLASDVLTHLRRTHPNCFAALKYTIVEKVPSLIAAQQHQLQPLMQNWDGLSWRSFEQIPSHSIVGCCFSNELVDALPVHLITIENSQLREIYVTIQPNSVQQSSEVEAETVFAEVTGPLSTPRLRKYFHLVEIDLPSDRYPQGYRSEVNLAALDWLQTVSDRLQRGYLLTIDYGYPASRYYNPARSQGTLQCYHRHAHHSDPYQYIGEQDITAHVDFTALEQYGQSLGLEKIGFLPQGLFLMALGLGDRIAALSQPDRNPEPQAIQTILQRREALHLLVNPMGMGNFGVLLQGKGLSATEQATVLKGLKIPYA